MNALEMRESIDQKLDRTKSARYSDAAYYAAINRSQTNILKERVEPIRTKGNYAVQSTERIRAELYTLIPAPATGVPVSNVVSLPTDYYYYLMMYVTLAGVSQRCKAVSYNEDVDANPFKKSSAVKPYFNEFTGGLRILSGTSTASAYSLTYIKNPAVVSIGFERDKIIAGTVLAVLVYYVYEEAVFNGVTYYPGETFTGSALALTSGIIIPTAKVVNSDFPVNMHEEICTLAAAFMEGTVEDYNKKAMLDSDAEKS